MLSDGLSPWVRSDLRPRAPTPCTGWAPHLHATLPQDRVRSDPGTFDLGSPGAIVVWEFYPISLGVTTAI